MGKYIISFDEFIIKEGVNSFDKVKDNIKTDFAKSELIINKGAVKKGTNYIFLDGVEVGTFGIGSLGIYFRDKHNKKTYKNSIFLDGGFIIYDKFKNKGIAKETIKKIFEYTNVDNIFLYTLDWQGSVDIWLKIGGEIIFSDEDKELKLIKIKNNI